ncbi:MAG: calcium/sodium antiporter [Nanoarchaeota archaeon]|nr:calcium/sodium antiporter [Nanoarchaeota archaeon]
MVAPLLIVFGLLGLWFGSDMFVRGARKIARFFGISEMFIGLTIASIGTSIPEIAVSVSGALDILKGIPTSGIVIGDKVGSVINQISLILGIVGLFAILYVKKRELKREGIMLVSSLLLFFIFSYDGILTQLEGLVMLIIYFIYFSLLISDEIKAKKIKERKESATRKEILLNISLVIIGLVLVGFSANITIESGIALAKMWGVSQAVIGVIVIGFGTGLAELSVSLTSLFRGSSELAVGNLIGSNITDILFSTGVGVIITNFAVSESIIKIDIPVAIIFTLVVLAMFRKGLSLKRKEAITLLGMYLTYIFIRLFVFKEFLWNNG